jgi:3-isopropylmalate/(R)-2-methylmalate dehydratase large subunit
MGMTITEKIFANAIGASEVKAGQIVTAPIEDMIIQDATGAMTYYIFRDYGMKVKNPEHVHIYVDHFCPPGSLVFAEKVRESLDFCRDYGTQHNYMQGISHQMLFESGRVKPGKIYVGADSHTVSYGAMGAFSTGIGSTEACAVMATGELWFKVPQAIKVNITGELQPYVMSKDVILKVLSILGANGATYKTLEFTGDTVRNMSVASRFTMCNMSVEGGAKNAIVAPDEKVVEYLAARGVDPSELLMLDSDPDAEYVRTIEIDASTLAPHVAVPFSPANGKPIDEVEGTPLNQILMGACTNGRLEDIAMIAKILRGKKVKPGLKCMLYPATNAIYAEAAKAGYLEELSRAGCIIGNPGCGCCGIQNPLLPNEKCLATNNRNYIGRMGSPEAEVFVASPAVAAASAITGVITDPRKML